jgi:uncharacterized protein (TIGR00369 family)
MGRLPELLGLEITDVESGRVVGKVEVRPDLLGQAGYMVGGAVLSIADTLCAYGVSTAWPEGARGFTTVEVTCNFISAIKHGVGVCTAKLLHSGRTTQIWDAEFAEEATGRLLAAFRCTQVFAYA